VQTRAYIVERILEDLKLVIRVFIQNKSSFKNCIITLKNYYIENI